MLVTSFDASVLVITRERHRELPIGLLTWTRFPLRKAIPAAVHLGAQVVAPQFASFPLPGTPAEGMERGLHDAIAVATGRGSRWWRVPEAPRGGAAGRRGRRCIIVDDVLARPR